MPQLTEDQRIKFYGLAKQAGYSDEEIQKALVGGPMYGLGRLQEKLGTGGALPTSGAVVGGMIAGPVGAGVGGFTGQRLKQMMAKGGAQIQQEKQALGTPQELGEAGKVGGTAAILDAIGGVVAKGAGKLVGKVTAPIRRMLGQGATTQMIARPQVK